MSFLVGSVLVVQAHDGGVPHMHPNTPMVLGIVDEVKPERLIIKQKEGQRKEFTIDAQTRIMGANKATRSATAIKLTDRIALTSTTSGTATGSAARAQKVFVKEASMSAQARRRAVQGQIASISGTSVTLRHQTRTDRSYTIVVSSAIVIRDPKATGSATLASLQVGQRIIAVGDLSTGGSIIAKKIQVIPGRAQGLVKPPNATASARPNATRSATAKPSASASARPTAVPLP